MVYGVGWFPTAVRIRLSQPPAGLGLGLGLSLAIILNVNNWYQMAANVKNVIKY